MLKIITKEFESRNFFFEKDTDGVVYLNATKTAKEFNKRLDNWKSSKETIRYIDALSRSLKISERDLIVVRQGGTPEEQGTWIHKSLIILFARWLSPEFAVWCDLQIEDILKSGTTSTQPLTIQDHIFGLESAIKILKVNEASKILMLSTLYKKLGLDTSYLPKYSDEQHTESLSALLKKSEVGISAKKLNLILLSEGYLEVKTRKSTGSLLDEDGEKKPKIKTFKSLTEKGLEFGKNIISPHNQLETSPHYYESKFKKLIEELGV